jgi:hypothetical protein
MRMTKVKSKLTVRKWLRISQENSDKLESEAEANSRTLSAQADIILTKHYKND